MKGETWRRRLAAAAVRIGVVVTALGLVWLCALAYWEHDERLRYPPPGQLIAIGDGREIHLRTWGADHDGPTIILDVSAATPSSVWAWIAGDLGERHRVVAYDRPGLGWSRGANGPRDARSAAEALRTALRIAGHEPPFIVVGHSYGGYSARVFAGLYSDEIAGLALLDTTHPDGGGDTSYGRIYRLLAWRSHAGLMRLFPAGDEFGGLPPADAAAARAVSGWRSHSDAAADELEAWTLSEADVRRFGHYGDLPLLVLSGVGSDEHLERQRDLTSLSSASEFVQLNVGHISMMTDRQQSAQVSRLLGRFVDEALADAEEHNRGHGQDFPLRAHR